MTYGSSIFTSWFQIICEVNEVNLSLSYGGVEGEIDLAVNQGVSIAH